MQAVDLNLASRPFKNDTLPWVAFIVAVVALGSLTWWNVQTWREHREMLADLRESQSNIRERFTELDRRDEMARRRFEKVELAMLSTMSEKANEVIRWKSFSWTRLFNQLQEVQPWNVQMVSIRPVFRGTTRGLRSRIEDPDQVPVAVEGIAKSLKDFLEFERALIFDPHFERIEPQSTTTDENSGETLFRLRFLYDPRVGREVRERSDDDRADAPAADDVATVEPEEVERDLNGTEEDALQPDEASAALAEIGEDLLEESGTLDSAKLTRITRASPNRATGASGEEDAADAEPEGAQKVPPIVGAPSVAKASAEPADALPEPRGRRPSNVALRGVDESERSTDEDDEGVD